MKILDDLNEHYFQILNVVTQGKMKIFFKLSQPQDEKTCHRNF